MYGICMQGSNCMPGIEIVLKRDKGKLLLLFTTECNAKGEKKNNWKEDRFFPRYLRYLMHVKFSVPFP